MANNFKEIDKQIKTTYYNSDDDTIKEFLIPILKRSRVYKRETYSFSSAIFSLINEALIDVIKNNCKIYYIVGVEINEEDLNAIEEGLDSSNINLIEKEIISEFGEVEQLIKQLGNRYDREIYKHRLQVLSYLISKKILNIKIGFITKRGRIVNPNKFKFHPKVMIFTDYYDNTIVANGSTNESLGAHTRNEEAFDVFKSWNPATKEYYNRHTNKFDEFWHNKSKNIKTININTLIENKILKKYSHKFESKQEIYEIEQKLNELYNESEDKLPKKTELSNQNIPLPLWSHQKKVIENWFDKGNRGVIKFATGAGKTITALTGASELYNKIKKLAIIIVTPYKALSEQWDEVIKSKFPNLNNILAYESRSYWENNLSRLINSYNIGIKDNITITTTNTTFLSPHFQKTIERIKENVLLVADEVHHFGAKNITNVLPDKVDFRLGLSATPERYQDEKGSEGIIEYFGDVLKPEFTLKDALDSGVLCPYNYHPIIVELVKDEKGSYKKISNEIEKNWKKYKTEEEREEGLKSLLKKREGILNTASQKLILLRKLLLEKKEDIKDSLIYCQDIEHLERISSILFKLSIKNARITSREPSQKDRKDVFDLFKSGQRQMLLAVNCLDEGIDIPSINTAFVLASSGNPKQFIQRRGRLLRTLRNKSGKILSKDVNIYDFISLPPLDKEGKLPRYEEEILEKECKRIKEFSELALNKTKALGIIESYLKKINLKLH